MKYFLFLLRGGLGGDITAIAPIRSVAPFGFVLLLPLHAPILKPYFDLPLC